MNTPHDVVSQQIVSALVSPPEQASALRSQADDIRLRTESLWTRFPATDPKTVFAREHFFSALDRLFRVEDEPKLKLQVQSLQGLVYECVVLDASIPMDERLRYMQVVSSMPTLPDMKDIYVRLAHERVGREQTGLWRQIADSLAAVDGGAALELERELHRSVEAAAVQEEDASGKEAKIPWNHDACCGGSQRTFHNPML